MFITWTAFFPFREIKESSDELEKQLAAEKNCFRRSSTVNHIIDLNLKKTYSRGIKFEIEILKPDQTRPRKSNEKPSIIKDKILISNKWNTKSNFI